LNNKNIHVDDAWIRRDVFVALSTPFDVMTITCMIAWLVRSRLIFVDRATMSGLLIKNLHTGINFRRRCKCFMERVFLNLSRKTYYNTVISDDHLTI